MPLSVGDKLGHYAIVAPLGAGGMGEVYKARDTQLEREVAIKVLPQELARDIERLARFDREAKILAALNHPNIAMIHGLVESDGGRALVMELVPGDTLGARIKRGVMPGNEALRVALQIAEALEAAHEKGITHRDLKPGNVMITSTGLVKVLDFGLAAIAQPAALFDPSTSPTLSMGMTQAGVIMGTAAYMSPEQAEGMPVDKRADIWSFGVVLWEMLTGKRLFEGQTISRTLADVLRAPIEFDKVTAPAPIKNLLRRCLDRNVTTRLRDIGEARVVIQTYLANQVTDTPSPQETQSAPSSSRFRWAWPAAAFATLLALLEVSFIHFRERPVERTLVRVSVDLGPDAFFGARTTVAISPDGTRIVYPVRGAGGTQQLATRLLNQAATSPLPGTENGADPFFKPDGQWIGFGADGKLKKISVLGGAAVTLCDAPALRGASWGEDDNIIFGLGSLGSGLYRVPAAGGKPEPLTKPAEKGEVNHRWPQILPGGKAVLFTGGTNNTSFDNASVEALTLETGQFKVLQPDGYFGRYLADDRGAGRLVYIHEGVLFGVPFDPDKLEVRGRPSPLLEDVAGDSPTAGGQLDFSNTGTLVYRSGKSTTATYPVVTLDSSGKTEPLVPTPGQYNTPRFSPDGKRLALSVTTGKGTDINVWDPQREAMSHLTFNGQDNFNPVWTPDGKHIVFRTSANGGAIMWIRSDGAGDAQPLHQSKNSTWPSSFSPDGRRLAFSEVFPETDVDLFTLPLDFTDPEHPKPGKPEKFWGSPKTDADPMFSPDGHWIAYLSTESGQSEIFVRPFPGPGSVWQISVGGGAYPSWSRDGKQLFFRSSPASNRIYVVDYTAKGDTFAAGKPHLWSETPMRSFGGYAAVPIDLSPDGKHFAIIPLPQAAEEKGSAHVTFLFNFFDELRRRVPMGK